MGDKSKLLLAAIVFTALYYKVTAEEVKLLDMAPEAVDNLYKGCRKDASDKFMHSGLLTQELNHSAGFQKAWSANTQCSKLIPGGTKEHTAALLAYANGDADFLENFNKAVETMGVNVSIYENHFNFKSLYYLLMDSMTLLYQKYNKCIIVYAVSDEKCTAKKGSKVRFGTFTVVYSNYSVLKKMSDLDEKFIFNITSCFFANLGDNICSDDDTALLSPAEVFTVEEVNEITEPMNSDTYTEIILKHSEQDSLHHCYIFSRCQADVSTQWLVLALLALSLFFL